MSDNNIELIKKYKTTKDKNILNEIIEKNKGLVYWVSNRFRIQESYFTREDLEQEGFIGLIKAIEKFNLEYQYSFSTYCVKYIYGYINRFIQKTVRNELSLNEECGEDITLEETLQDNIDYYQESEGRIYNDFLHDVLESVMDKNLINDEKNVIKLRHGYYTDNKEVFFKDIAKLLGIEQKKAIALEKSGLRKMRRSDFARNIMNELMNEKWEYVLNYRLVEEGIN